MLMLMLTLYNDKHEILTNCLKSMLMLILMLTLYSDKHEI